MSEVQKFTRVEFKMSKMVFVSGLITYGLLCTILIGFLLLPIWIITYSTTKLVVGKDFLIIKSGWIAKKERKIPFSKINSVDHSEDFTWKLLFQNIGKIKVYTGNDSTSIDFTGLSNPKMVADLINDRIEAV